MAVDPSKSWILAYGYLCWDIYGGQKLGTINMGDWGKEVENYLDKGFYMKKNNPGVIFQSLNGNITKVFSTHLRSFPTY